MSRETPLKIAIVGKSETRELAPFDDPSWQIWAFGTIFPGDVFYKKGGVQHTRRYDRWYEVHPRFSIPDAMNDHLDGLGKKVYAIDPEYRNATIIEHEKIIKYFWPQFMSGSPAWALADAIKAGADEIGLWGITQSHEEEWFSQRLGTQHFLWIADFMGIKITLPEGCDLIDVNAPPAYPEDYGQ